MKKKLLLYIGVIILIIGIGSFFVYQNCYKEKAKEDKNINSSTSNNKNNDKTEVEEDSNIDNNTSDNNQQNNEKEEEKDDIYGYAYMSYMANDGTFTRKYKIVQLHKNQDNKVLANVQSDAQNGPNTENEIRDLRILNNKLYYIVGYYGEGVLDNYSKLMSINLDDEDYSYQEILSTKDSQAFSETCRGITSATIRNDNIYIHNRCGHFYQYDISTKEFQVIKSDDYPSGYDPSESYRVTTGNDRLYINGKEFILDKNKNELTYDGKQIYKSKSTDYLSGLNYLSDNEIIFSECIAFEQNEAACERKYLKYDLSTNTVDLMDNQQPTYYMRILYKNY